MTFYCCHHRRSTFRSNRHSCYFWQCIVGVVVSCAVFAVVIVALIIVFVLVSFVIVFAVADVAVMSFFFRLLYSRRTNGFIIYFVIDIGVDVASTVSLLSVTLSHFVDLLNQPHFCSDQYSLSSVNTCRCLFDPVKCLEVGVAFFVVWDRLTTWWRSDRFRLKT